MGRGINNGVLTYQITFHNVLKVSQELLESIVPREYFNFGMDNNDHVLNPIQHN